MSHFTVLVTKTNKVPLDSQLAPFDENVDVIPYQTPCRCIGCKAQTDALHQAAAQLGTSPSDLCREWDPRAHSWEEFTRPCRDLAAKLEREHPLRGQPDLDCPDCKGTGERTITYNPKSQWDWYQVGGRWLGYFKLKQGATGQLGEAGVGGNEPLHDADIAWVKDIDWHGMREHARRRAEANWSRFHGNPASAEAFLYNIASDDTQDTYIAHRCSVATDAVLHDGQWHAQGEMVSFGISDDSMTGTEWNAEFERIIASLDPNDEVTVVDCHI